MTDPIAPRHSKELDLFLDAELSDDARESIRHHLDGCPDCLGAFDFHAELKIVIHRKCQENEMPLGLMSRIESCFDLSPLAED